MTNDPIKRIEYDKRYNEKHREEIKARRRLYMREWRKNNLDKIIASDIKWRQKKENKNTIKECQHQWKINNKEKYIAQKKLTNRVYLGIIIKPPTCEHCGKVTLLHGHHNDYNKPFDVVWLCPSCHGQMHRRA